MHITFIHGRFARDPELIRGESAEKDRCKFTVASDRQYGDKADFLDCIIFGKRAAAVEKWFKKGQEIVLIAEEQIEPYTDKNGNKRKSHTYVVKQFEFCGSSRNEQKEPAAVASAEPEPDFEEINEDIPF
jgi:single-strand DNA-binding protein